MRPDDVNGGSTPHTNVAPAGRPVRPLRPAPRVLVVDDHPSFRRCARALLAEEGFEVVAEAEDGAAALVLAADRDPDLVLLDVRLPEADGFEIASHLRERHPHLAIVLVSIGERSDYGSLVEQSGARGFVTKAELSGAVLEELLG